IAGKFAAWTHDSRHRTVIVERGLLGGACPNVACLPSKHLIWSAKVISLARRGMEFGLKTESLSVDMAVVQRRKRTMVRELRKAHEEHTEASGAELIYGIARFVAPPHGGNRASRWWHKNNRRRPRFSRPRFARSNPRSAGLG